jgi:RNA polymerase sigma factor (sigma-70 family)
MELAEAPWFDVFVPRMNDRFFRYFYRYFGDEERARDLTQDVWKRFLRDDRLRPHVESSRISDEDLNYLERWIWRVAANLRIDEYREDEVRQRGQLEIEGPAGDSPERDLERREKANCVQQALSRMQNETHREAMLLKNAGYRYEEISNITGLEQTAIGTTLHRTRKAFREVFCGVCPEICSQLSSG